MFFSEISKVPTRLEQPESETPFERIRTEEQRDYAVLRDLFGGDVLTPTWKEIAEREASPRHALFARVRNELICGRAETQSDKALAGGILSKVYGISEVHYSNITSGYLRARSGRTKNEEELLCSLLRPAKRDLVALGAVSEEITELIHAYATIIRRKRAREIEQGKKHLEQNHERTAERFRMAREQRFTHIQDLVGSGLGTNEIAREIGIASATLKNVLSEMRHEGMLPQDFFKPKKQKAMRHKQYRSETDTHIVVAVTPADKYIFDLIRKGGLSYRELAAHIADHLQDPRWTLGKIINRVRVIFGSPNLRYIPGEIVSQYETSPGVKEDVYIRPKKQL